MKFDIVPHNKLCVVSKYWPLYPGCAKKEVVCTMRCPTRLWNKNVYSCSKWPHTKSGVLKLFDHLTSSSVQSILLLLNILQQRYWYFSVYLCLSSQLGWTGQEWKMLHKYELSSSYFRVNLHVLLLFTSPSSCYTPALISGIMTVCVSGCVYST